MLPYGRQSITDDDIQAVVEALRGDYLTTGPTIDRFEHSLAQACDAAHAIAVSNGTAALHIAMLALGVGPGDTVFVPAITFAATANAARYCGAEVRFIDVEPDTICMSPAALDAAVADCRSRGGRPRLVAPVHFGGHPCDMPAIAAVARAHGLQILEDACHALGASFEDHGQTRRVGACDYSAATVFSFHPVKHITTGEGGAVLVRDTQLAARLRSLRSHGIVRDSAYLEPTQALDSQGLANPWYAEMRELGYNYRLTDIQAALGISQLKRLPQFVSHRRELVQLYRQQIATHLSGYTTVLAERAGYCSSYHLCAVRVDFKQTGLERGEFMRGLSAQGIGTQVHYLPVYRHPYYRQRYGDLGSSCPVAEEYYRQALSLPLYVDLQSEKIEGIVHQIKKILAR